MIGNDRARRCCLLLFHKHVLPLGSNSSDANWIQTNGDLLVEVGAAGADDSRVINRAECALGDFGPPFCTTAIDP